jgi:hypothetical protein
MQRGSPSNKLQNMLVTWSTSNFMLIWCMKWVRCCIRTCRGKLILNKHSWFDVRDAKPGEIDDVDGTSAATGRIHYVRAFIVANKTEVTLAGRCNANAEDITTTLSVTCHPYMHPSLYFFSTVKPIFKQWTFASLPTKKLRKNQLSWVGNNPKNILIFQCLQ